MSKATVACILMSILCVPAFGQDWLQWRGANRDGTIRDFKAPAAWPESLKLKWRVEVGGGFSSPLVAGESVYVHSRDEAQEEEVVSRIDLKTGRIVWQQRYPVAFSKNQYAVRMGKGPHATPVLHNGRLYTLGVTAIVSSFDAASGALKWRKDFSQKIDTSKLFCGTSMSPVVAKSGLIIHVGDDRGGRMLALDPMTGEERWSWEGEGPGYASPLIVSFGGRSQVVTLTDKSIIGVGVDDGKLLWREPYADEWNENIITPVLYGETLIISGVRRGTMALRVRREGETWKPERVWENKQVAMYMSSPVLDGHLLYGMSHLRKGQYFCLDARSGNVLWMTEGREGDNAALVGAGDLLFILNSDANLIIARKSEKGFEPVKKYQVAESATWSHPVILRSQIVVKDAASIALWSF